MKEHVGKQAKIFKRREKHLFSYRLYDNHCEKLISFIISKQKIKNTN